MKAQRERQRAHQRELDKKEKELKDDALMRFKLAKDKLKEYVPGVMVDAWCLSFKETCTLFQLDKKQALSLFFVKVTTDSSWVMEFLVDDRKRGRVIDDSERWLDRLRRTYAQSYSTKLQVVRNLRQEENEAADTFVHRFRAQAKAAHSDWSTTELINMIQNAVHPKWRQSFILMNSTSTTFPQVIDALSKAMSPQLSVLRKLCNKVDVADDDDNGSVTEEVAAAASTADRRSRSRARSHRQGEANAGFESRGQSRGFQSQPHGSGGQRSGNTNSDACRRCGAMGHWARDCHLNVDPATLHALWKEKTASGSSVPKNA